MPKPQVYQIGKEWAVERGRTTVYFHEWKEAMRFALGKSTGINGTFVEDIPPQEWRFRDPRVAAERYCKSAMGHGIVAW